MTPIMNKILLNFVIIVGSLVIYLQTADIEIITHVNGFGDPKELKITLTLKEPKRFGYLKGNNDFVF